MLIVWREFNKHEMNTFKANEAEKLYLQVRMICFVKIRIYFNLFECDLNLNIR